MKNLIAIGVLVLVLFSCSNQNKNGNEAVSEDIKSEAVVYSIDDLYTNAENLVDKEIVIEGTVMHVCKHGGERCFLMGSNEDVNIRIEAGEKIGAFSQEQMGSDLVISGVLKEVKTEADAHNPGQEHGDGEVDEDAETANAHNVIAEAQEAAAVVYFIEGVKVNKEL